MGKKETYKSSYKRCDELWGVLHEVPAWGSDSSHLARLLSSTSWLPALVGMVSSWSALPDQVFHITKPVVLLGWLPLRLSSDLSQKKDVKIEWFLMKKMENMSKPTRYGFD